MRWNFWQTRGGDYSDALTLEVTLTEQENGQGNFSAEYDSQEGSTGNLSLDAYANAEKSVTLQVTNNGNVALQNLTFSSDLPTDWEVSFDQSEIETLEAGQSVEVTAYITPDQDAITGDYIATLSISNDEVSSEAQFRVSVKTRTVWGIFAVVIIVALVGVLGFVIKKYGRR